MAQRHCARDQTVYPRSRSRYRAERQAADGDRIYPSGKKSFVISYRNARAKKRLFVLGRYGADLTLDQARRRAIRERGRITEGIDPVGERKAARTA